MSSLINAPKFEIKQTVRISPGSREGIVRAIRWNSDDRKTWYGLDTGHSYLIYHPEERLSRV